MDDHKDLRSEIDAIVQNTSKKKVLSTVSRFFEIFIDQKNSDLECIKGKFSLITQKKYLDKSIEEETVRTHNFKVMNGEFLIEKYDDAFSRDVVKTIRDTVMGICQIAKEKIMRMPIGAKSVFQCRKKHILIICDSGKNSSTKDIINEMLYSGQVHYAIDTENMSTPQKSLQWAVLEAERHVAHGESIVITGVFRNWYELMPFAVLSAMYGHDIIMGKSAGQRLSVGDTIGIDVALQHFMSSPEMLREFSHDPYSAIEHFRKIDDMLNSLVIFPSVLHAFFSR